MRLIDADALTAKEIEQKEYWMSRGHGDGGTNIVLAALEQAPTVPAEVVVHCGECEYKAKAKANEKGFLICPASGMEITDNDFCSYGERRESGAGK